MKKLRSVIEFRVIPGKEAAFERAFADAGMLTRPAAIAGYRGAELIQSLEDPTHYMVFGTWSTIEAYRQWQAVSIEQAPGEAINRLSATLRDTRPGRMFVVAQASDDA